MHCVKSAKDEKYGPYRLCYFPRSRKVAETGPYLSSLADFTYCIFRSLISARRCNYSDMCSWWWVELPPETCRAVYRNI